MLELLGLIFLGMLSIFAWAEFRSAREGRPTAEQLLSTLRLRNEFANRLAVAGALVLLFAVGANSFAVTIIGGSLVALAFTTGWLADRTRAPRIQYPDRRDDAANIDQVGSPGSGESNRVQAQQQNRATARYAQPLHR
jgi:hypothetical protein